MKPKAVFKVAHVGKYLELRWQQQQLSGPMAEALKAVACMPTFFHCALLTKMTLWRDTRQFEWFFLLPHPSHRELVLKTFRSNLK